MKSRLACAAMLTALAWAPAGWTVGLGEADLRSALNQPLDARIELVSPTQQELEALRVSLASPEHFERYGLERTAMHTRLRFQLVEEGDGAYIHVTTQDPVREPFVSFLVEARWASGRLLREYTFLLDPPTYGPDEADEADQPRRAVRSEREPERETQRESRPAESQQEQATEPESGSEAGREERTVRTDTRRPSADDSRQTGGQYGPIRRNETLWNIADRLRPSGVSINRMMIALFQANPGAFDDNINHLREGAVLRVPEQSEIESVSVAQANRQVAQQNESWRGARTRTADTGTPEREQQDELRLVAPGDEDAEGVGVGTDDASERVAQLESELEDIQAAQQETAEENEELSSRVSELQTELEEQRRLVELKDEQLASLQQRVRDGDLEEGLEDDAIFADEQSGDETGDAGVEDEEATGDETDADGQMAGTDTPDSDKPGDEEAKPAEEEEVAAGPSGEDQAAGESGDAATETETAEATDAEGQEATDTAASDQESAEERARRGRVAESPSLLDRAMDLATSPVGMGVMGALALAGLLGLVAVRRRGKSDEADGDEASLADEAADAAEAEDGGAVEDVNLTGDESVEDRGGDADAASGDVGLSVDEVVDEADFHIAYGTYDKAASQLEEALGNHPREGRLHLKLLETYFAAGNADAFVTAAGRLRNELGEDGSEWSEAARMGREIAPDESMFAGAAPSDGGESGSDLAPPSAGDESGGDESPFDLDLDTGEAGESQEPEGLDIPDEGGSDEGGLDLPDAGETDSTGALGDTVDTSQGDDDLSFDLPDLEESDSDKEEPAPAESSSDEGESEIDWSGSDDESLDFGLDEDSASALDRTADEESGEGSSEEVDFPTVDVPPEKASEAFGTDSQAQFEKAFQELSSYIGSESEEEGGVAETTEDRPGQTTDDDASPSGIDFGDDDDDDLLDLGEEEGDEMGEIDTKVDLARAYIDMGDSDGARGILEEVIEEGNEDQKKEAQSLLDSI